MMVSISIIEVSEIAAAPRDECLFFALDGGEGIFV